MTQYGTHTIENSGIGPQLRAAREARNLTIVDVANKLKLSEETIAALEEERFDDLPGPAYVRGYIRNYARLVDLETHDMQVPPDNTPPPLTSFISRPATQIESNDLRIRAVTYTVIATLALLLFLWWQTQWGNRKQELAIPVVEQEALQSGPPPRELTAVKPPEAGPLTEQPGPAGARARDAMATPPLPSTSDVVAAAPATTGDSPETALPWENNAIDWASAPSEPSSGVASTAAAEAPEIEQPALDQHKLVLQTAAQAWIEISDAEGNRLYYDLAAPEETISVDGVEPFNLVIGNANRVTLYYNGQAVDLAPLTTDSVANFSLSQNGARRTPRPKPEIEVPVEGEER